MKIKLSIKERLQKKTVREINAIAKRMKCPLYGCKRQRINLIDGYFKSPAIWDAIANSK